ncbi:hypothetical protein DRN97_02160 [Methanosarcinales archaeon]|nr:MAG: hypothetical protein DRN97_02160 [Methanosarcinales archaeon]
MEKEQSKKIREAVNELYEAYKEAVNKEKKVGDVKAIVEELQKENILLERAYTISFEEGIAKISFSGYSGDINKEIAEKLWEICDYAIDSGSIAIVVETKEKLDKTAVVGNGSVACDFLEKLGFTLSETADCIKAEYLLKKNDTAVAYIEFSHYFEED